MKYIAKFHRTGYSFDIMYMISNRYWTDVFGEATVSKSSQAARNLVYRQYPAQDPAWDYMTILEYTDKEYFKAVLKG